MQFKCAPAALGSMHPARPVLFELLSGLTVLGLATFVFVAALQPHAVPARSSSANSAPEPLRAYRRLTQVDGHVRDVGNTSAASDSAHGDSRNVVTIPPCDAPGGMGLSRIVEIDSTGGPEFGFQHLKGYDFLRDKEVVLTFDDGPWPDNTAAVLKALKEQCLKATFFEIGEHASWHPEITRQVIEAGMTVGTHTWSHKDLARNPFARDIERAEQEIELGNSAVHMAAAGAAIAPFFRFPALMETRQQLEYLAKRNIAIFSTDIDSRDFAMHKPEQVIESVMSQLKKRGKGIILMHDFHRNTARALPELLRQLKDGGYKIVHVVPKAPLTTIPEYDEMLKQDEKLSSNNTRLERNVVRTIAQ